MMCNWELITFGAAGLPCPFNSKTSNYLLNFRIIRCIVEVSISAQTPAPQEIRKTHSQAHAEQNPEYISRTLVIKYYNVTELEALTVFVYDGDSIIAL